MLFSKKVLKALRDLNYVKVIEHPTLPITLYNYTTPGNFEMLRGVRGALDYLGSEEYETLLYCRGLCFDRRSFDDKYRYVENLNAPFPKFFNRFEVPEDYVNGVEKVDVSPKLDGSLVIRFVFEGEEIWHTRGGFDTIQALEAKRIHRELHGETQCPPDVTLLYEVIYPENKIVTDYGDREVCALLATMSNKTLTDVSRGPRFILGENGRVDLSEKTLEDFERHRTEPEFEGVVVSFEKNGKVYRVKYKRKEYLDLQKLLIGFNRSAVMEKFVDLGYVSTRAAFDDLPEEYRAEFLDYSCDYESERVRLISDIMSHFTDKARKTWTTKKELATLVKGLSEAPAVFKMYDIIENRGDGDYSSMPYGEDGSLEPRFDFVFKNCLRKRLGIR